MQYNRHRINHKHKNAINTWQHNGPRLAILSHQDTKGRAHTNSGSHVVIHAADVTWPPILFKSVNWRCACWLKRYLLAMDSMGKGRPDALMEEIAVHQTVPCIWLIGKITHQFMDKYFLVCHQARLPHVLIQLIWVTYSVVPCFRGGNVRVGSVEVSYFNFIRFFHFEYIIEAKYKIKPKVAYNFR